jgi:hypothetical protein
MPISREIDKARNLTVFTVSGDVKADEILSALKAFWEGEVTLNVLWDARGASGIDLESFHMEAFADFSSHYGDRLKDRQGGRSAIVSPTDLEFGLSRIVEISQSLRDSPFEIKVFRSIDDAKEWLKGK